MHEQLTGAVTLQTIADQCGVSICTVSKALRGKPGLNPATVERVCAAATALGYSTLQHQAARRLALQKHGRDVVNHAVALFLPPGSYAMHGTTSFFDQLAHGVLDVLMADGYALLLANFSDFDPEITLPTVVQAGNVDGAVVVANTGAADRLLGVLRASPAFGARPVVAIQWDSFSPCSTVSANDIHGAYLAAGHLLDLGHRHLLQFALADEWPRLEGVRQALAERGLDPGRHLHPLVLPTHWLDPESISAEFAGGMPEGAELLLGYLAAHPEVTAFMGLNDACAIRAWYVLQRAGWRLPEQFSIIGFDDTHPLPDEHGSNRLTTVRQPLRELGEEAARLLLAHLTGATTQTQVRLPVELVVRGSTTAPGR